MPRPDDKPPAGKPVPTDATWVEGVVGEGAAEVRFRFEDGAWRVWCPCAPDSATWWFPFAGDHGAVVAEARRWSVLVAAWKADEAGALERLAVAEAFVAARRTSPPD